MVEETPVDMSHGYMPLGKDMLTPIRHPEESAAAGYSSRRRLPSTSSSSPIYLEEDKIAPASMGHEDQDDSNIMEPLLHYSSPAPPLNQLNYVNGLTFLAHLFVSWGIGIWGLDGKLETRWQIGQDYETLVTPAQWSYWIWLPILVFEAIFAMAQLLPDFRARPMIQNGTGYFFFYTCLIQTAWTLFFSFRLLMVSFVTVVIATVSLACLLVSQHRNQSSQPPMTQQEPTQHFDKIEYWLFRFPFALHFGWMSALTAVHFSLLFRSRNSSLATQLAANICSLATMFGVALFFLVNFNYSRTPDFVVPIVIIWAMIGIATRLIFVSDSLLQDFGEVIVHAVEEASWILVGIMSCLLIPRVLVWTCRSFFTIHVVQLNEDTSFGETLSL